MEEVVLHALEEIESVIDMVANFATDNLERSHRHKGSAKHVLLSCHCTQNITNISNIAK